jgi:tryptophan halogenase
MFAEPSWVQVMHGQRVHPRGYHPLVDNLTDEKLREHCDTVRGVIANCVRAMPTHDAFIAKHCATAKAA